jgi:6-phosphogluconolactonase
MSDAPMTWTLHEYANADALVAACSARIGESIDTALGERGHALLALSGGRTSPPVFRRVAAQARDWSRITILPSDERWVAADHPDCNLRQMREAFAGAEGIRWLSLTPAQPHGDVQAAFANGALASYPQPFDVCMLGMGADGHFASLFPGAPTLARALDPANPNAAIAIVPDPMPSAGPHPRVSLTLTRILKSRRLLLVITGVDKRAVIEHATASVRPELVEGRCEHIARSVHGSTGSPRTEATTSVRPELVEGRCDAVAGSVHGSTGSPRTEATTSVRPELVEGRCEHIVRSVLGSTGSPRTEQAIALPVAALLAATHPAAEIHWSP